MKLSVTFIKMLCMGLFISFRIVACEGCDDERILDDVVSLDLNFQICTDASNYTDRGLTIRWEGHLREAASGATSGETSFTVPYAVHFAVDESPDGRSWFHRSIPVLNLRAGEWDIEVEYVLPSGTGEDIHERFDLLGTNNIYFTHGNDLGQTSGFPACP